MGQNDYFYGDYTWYLDEPEQKDLPKGYVGPMCECGTHKTYGENCEKWLHSIWCPLYADTKEKK